MQTCLTSSHLTAKTTTPIPLRVSPCSKKNQKYPIMPRSFRNTHHFCLPHESQVKTARRWDKVMNANFGQMFHWAQHVWLRRMLNLENDTLRALFSYSRTKVPQLQSCNSHEAAWLKSAHSQALYLSFLKPKSTQDLRRGPKPWLTC